MRMKTTIILPTLNEEKNILPLITRIKKLYPKINIIIADDGSRDNTQLIVRKISKKDRSVRLLDRTNKKVKGLTASVLDALNYVKTEFVVVMDADLQHPPEKIKEIVKKLKNNDVVIGTRKKIRFESSFRNIQSFVAIWLGRIKLRNMVKDPVSGFFGIRTQLFRAVVNNNKKRFVLKGFKILLDLLKCLPKNAKIANAYYDFLPRKRGRTKIGTKQVVYYIKSLLS